MIDRGSCSTVMKAVDSTLQGRILQVNGVSLHCIEMGPQDGPLVILLHGFPEFWWGWRYQIAPLAEAGFRVIVPDQRGYNLSSKPDGRMSYHLDLLAKDVVDLSSVLGRQTFSVVGHDWGGIVAWWVATCYPEQVDHLAIINAPHASVVGQYMRRHPRQMLRSSYAAFFQIPHVPEMMLSRKNYRALRHALQQSSRRGTFSDSDLAAYEKAWSQPGALTAMLNWYRALLSKPEKKRVRIRVPTLVIWGERDVYLEKGLAEASLALCDDGRAVWIESGTHFVHHEEPDAVNEALLTFLKG